ncbi:hypothetical protein M569_09998 [Genlisea aurea]|uniref:Uncharacterized protein n=1 Tax=Genlisea aurea TaxID=192259 RepID=S8DXT9_9LAMI|nr:hypothetical protein M569_09998 [Genlisea aurea]
MTGLSRPIYAVMGDGGDGDCTVAVVGGDGGGNRMYGIIRSNPFILVGSVSI